MDFLDPKIEQYALSYSDPESDLLYELNRQTHLKVLQPRMLSGHLQGRVLSSYSRALAPKNILEIGTYTGYSALCLAEGLKKNGSLHTIEINNELASFTKFFFDKSKYKDQIHFHIGDALELIPKIVDPDFLKCPLAISLADITGFLFNEAIATDALSIILLITISIESLFNFELSLAISAIFQASCFFFGRLIFDGYTLTLFNNKITPSL